MEVIWLREPGFRRLRLGIFNVFFQLANLPVEPDEVGNDTGKDQRNNSNNNPDFSISPKLVGHFDLILKK